MRKYRRAEGAGVGARHGEGRILACQRCGCGGFTLLELLVVTLIIAVLAALFLPVLARAQERGRSAACVGNLRQMGGAILMYYAERGNQPFILAETKADGSPGPIWPVNLALAGYLSGWDGNPATKPCGKGVWTCPSCKFTSDSYGGYGVVEGIFNYPQNAVSGPRMSSIERPQSTWLVGEAMWGTEPATGWYAVWQRESNWAAGHGPAVGRHGGDRANVCMFDGHVEALSLQALREGRYTYPTK